MAGTSGTVIAFPGGRQSHAQQLPIYSPGNLGGIKPDNAGNLLVDDPAGSVTEYTEAGVPTGTKIATGGWLDIALDHSGKTLFGADAGGNEGIAVTFPGGVERRTYQSPQFSSVVGVAVDPGQTGI